MIRPRVFSSMNAPSLRSIAAHPQSGFRASAALGLGMLGWALFFALDRNIARPLLFIYEIAVAAGLVSLAWGIWTLLRPRARMSRRWKAALVLICLGMAGIVNSFVGMLALRLGVSSSGSDAVVMWSGIFTYVCWSIALFVLPAKQITGGRKLPWIMDVAMIVAALSAAGWFFLISPQVMFEGPRFAVWLTLAYPLADMISVASVVAAVSLGRPYRSARVFLMMGIALNVAGDVVQSVFMLHRGPVPFSYIHCLWILAALLVGLVALRTRFDADRSSVEVSTDGAMQGIDLARALVPMLFLAALVALALWGYWTRCNTRAAVGLDIGCAVATVCALVRLHCLIKDNTDLAKSLAAANTNLDSQVRERTEQLSVAMDELERQKMFLRSVIDALPSFVVAKTADGSIALANETAARFFGKTVEEVQASNYAEMVSSRHKDAPMLLAEDDEVLRLGKPIVDQDRDVVAADGQTRTVEVVKTPVIGRSGRPEQVLIVANDITVRKEAERNLIAARDAAEQAIRIKSQFLANMSHEIRTPMNGVIGFTDLLLAEELPPEHRDLAASIKSSSEGLLQIINDILDVTKLDSGQISLEPAPTSLSVLCAEVMDAHRPQAESKSIELRCDVRLDQDARFLTDPGRLKQALAHLVANAIKFTDSGTVSLGVDMLRQGREVSHVRVSIADTGVGIPEDRIDQIFEPFSQVDNSITRRYGGTGLGLSICRQLLTLLGGTVRAESAVGAGSVFLVDLPLKSAEFGCAPSDPLWSLSGMHVLVVEDNEVNQKVIKRILERAGCSVNIANNGLEAVEWLVERRCDLILMDCQMPVMDGLEATRRIRTFEAPAREVPIIAVTANAMAGDREMCLAAGMDDYVPKPIKLEALTGAIARVAAARAA